MSVTDLRAFRHAKAEEEKKQKRLRPRLLQSRTHTCWHHYQDCHKCSDPIAPGMMYTREVYASLYGIQVFKCHWPECPEDTHLDYLRQMEEEQRRQEEEAKKAA